MIEKTFKEKAGTALRLALTQIAVAVLSIIVYVFVTMFAVSAFSNQVGYDVYIENEQGQYEYLYSHHYEDGDDAKLESYDESKIYKQSIRKLSSGAEIANKIIVQLITAFIFVYLVYGYIWNKGNQDRAKADFENQQGNTIYGLKIGLFGAVPFFVIYLLLIAEKIFGTSFALSAFKITNFSFFYIVELACNNMTKMAEVPAWSFLPLLLIVLILPAVSWFGYTMGYKNISLGKNIVYSKNNGGK